MYVSHSFTVNILRFVYFQTLFVPVKKNPENITAFPTEGTVVVCVAVQFRYLFCLYVFAYSYSFKFFCSVGD